MDIKEALQSEYLLDQPNCKGVCHSCTHEPCYDQGICPTEILDDLP